MFNQQNDLNHKTEKSAKQQLFQIVDNLRSFIDTSNSTLYNNNAARINNNLNVVQHGFENVQLQSGELLKSSYETVSQKTNDLINYIERLHHEDHEWIFKNPISWFSFEKHNETDRETSSHTRKRNIETLDAIKETKNKYDETRKSLKEMSKDSLFTIFMTIYNKYTNFTTTIEELINKKNGFESTSSSSSSTNFKDGNVVNGRVVFENVSIENYNEFLKERRKQQQLEENANNDEGEDFAFEGKEYDIRGHHEQRRKRDVDINERYLKEISEKNQ